MPFSILFSTMDMLSKASFRSPHMAHIRDHDLVVEVDLTFIE